MGLLRWIYEDPRFEQERKAFVLTVLLGLPLLLAVGWFLLRAPAEQKPTATVPTAETVLPEATSTPTPRKNPLAPASQAFAAGRHDEARALLEGVMPSLQGAELAQAWTMRAEIDWLAGRLEEALEALNQAIALEANSWRLFWRGHIQRQLGRLDEAAMNLKLAQDLEPAHPLFSNAVLLLELERGQAEQVAQTIRLKQNLGLESTRATWVFAAAALALAQRQPEMAVVYLREGVKALPPHQVDALLDYAALNNYRNEPAVMAFFIKTSTERVLPGKR